MHFVTRKDEWFHFRSSNESGDRSEHRPAAYRIETVAILDLYKV